MHNSNLLKPLDVAARSFLLLIALAAATSTSTLGEENLVPNPGFESVAASEEEPAGWSFTWKNTHSGDAAVADKKQPPEFALDTRHAHEGQQSVRIGVRRAQDDGVLTAEVIAADPAVKVYRAGVWIKTEAMEKSTARLCAVFLGDAGKWLGANYAVAVAEESHDWRHYVGFFEPPKGTRQIRIRLWVNMHNTGTGTAWFDDVAVEATNLVELPPLVYVDRNAPPPLTEDDRRRGYLPFIARVVETVYPTSVPSPEQRLEELRLLGFPGEREAATFCLRAIEDLPEIRLEAGPLKGDPAGVIPSENISIQPVECLIRQGQSRWGPLADKKMLKPVYIAETNVTSAKKNTTRQLWVTVHVPEGTPAGEYRGAITLRTAKSAWSVPIRLDVYPFELPEVPGVAFGMYERLHEDDTFMDFLFADMRAHGMTTVGLCCGLGAEMSLAEGRARVAFTERSDLVRAMRAYTKAGFPEPVVWLMSADVLRWSLRQGPLESEAFARAYRGVLLEILAYAKAAGWPEIIFQPVDEPFEHTSRMPAAKRCLDIMKTIPGLRTEEDGPNGNPPLLEELYDLCDVLVYHDGPWVDRKTYDAEAWEKLLSRARADGKTLWFYNIDLTGYHPEAMRFGYGFGLWAGQGQGVIEWAFMFGYRPDWAEAAYTNPTTMFFRYPRTANHPGGPSIGWEATREGVKDYKLLSLFQAEVRKALAGGDAAKSERARRAKAEVEEALGRIRFESLMARAAKGQWTGRFARLDDGTLTISGSYKMPNAWTFEDYDSVRRRMADAIVEIAFRRTVPAGNQQTHSRPRSSQRRASAKDPQVAEDPRA